MSVSWSEDPKAYQREWMRKRRAADPAFRKGESDRQRAWQKKNPLKHAMTQYKGSARRRGLECTLTPELLESFLTKDCTYCEASPNPINGIDRVNSSLGYIEGNMVTSCRTCNIAKAQMSKEEFLSWIESVYKYSRKRRQVNGKLYQVSKFH